MNRKDRRAAQKQGKGGGVFAPAPSFAPAALGANLFASAVQHFRSGRMADAERYCRDLLTVTPDHADALHLLGMIAYRTAHHDAALELIGKAVALNPRNPDSRFNLAQVFRALGRLDDAADQLTQATVLKRDYAAAHLQLADMFLQQGRFEQAETHYRRVLAMKPSAEVCSNLGIALASQGKWDEAAAQYRRALTLNPELVDVYRNLGRALLMQGDAAQALALARRALAIGETEEMKAFFVQCVKALPAKLFDDELRALVARALTEGWSRPSELSALAAELFKQRQGECPHDDIAALAGDELLRAILETAPVRDIELERTLTAARKSLLAHAITPAVSNSDDPTLGFFYALARQCFINEYVFERGDDETAQLQNLLQTLWSVLQTGEPIPALQLAAAAAYVQLHSIPGAEALSSRCWPDSIAPLIDQQVREPLQEQEIRSSIPALTRIEDAVSQKVQRQYEEMPYPRWVKAAPAGRPVTLDWYLRNQFPQAPIHDFGTRDGLDVLIAGCGTGQHAIESGQRFTGARVLAVDLSLTSLSYAIRKSRALGLSNIEYGQADILQLGAIDRSFDLIESSGVLHHLAAPEQGWRVLLSLLRPGGFMHVGLYSALARADIRAARALIAERGYSGSADDIRRCRQELLAYADGTPLKNVAKYPDFFTTSECRDLLFHVQEHQLTIPQIAGFLRENNLAFIGFTGQHVQEYRKRFPEDKAATDLERWHAFENENPTTFTGMYQFWVQKL
jgi:tetratricopeptide (TPR) repeat protein/SAM-dependent methyltransferase